MTDHEDLRIPGEYMLALVWFERRTAKGSGNRYLQCKFVVVAGSQKGKGFFTPWGLNMENRHASKRWQIWMEQVDCREEVDLDSDQAISRVFKGKAFKAEVKLSQRNGYDNTDIHHLIYPGRYDEMDRADMRAWEKEWSERGWQSQDPGHDPGPSGDDRPPPPQSEPQWSPGSSFADDDEDEAPF